MRFRLLSLLLVLMGVSATAQVYLGEERSRGFDSLKLELFNAKDEKKQAEVFRRISGSYMFVRPDTAIIYAYRGLAIARKYDIHTEECILIRNIGTAYRMLGNTSKAFEFFLTALRIAEAYNPNQIGILGMQLGIINQDYGKVHEAINMFKKSITLLDSIEELTFATIARIYLADGYLAINEPDSALEQCEEALEIMGKNKLGSYTISNLLYTRFGEIWQAKEKYDSAITNFRYAIAEAKDSRGLSATYFAMAKLYQELNVMDSSIIYASKAFGVARAANIYLQMDEACSLLVDLYRNNRDSLLTYSQWALAVKDSLYKMNQAIAFESITGYEEREHNYELESAQRDFQYRIRTNALLGGSLTLALVAFLLYRNNRTKQRANKRIEKAYDQLKATQSQLIQSEKMASLGELTAGIAHEIQNPLNFVNNFSEINSELIDEMKSELKKGNYQEVEHISTDIKENEEKIKHHGKRADAIVKSMLQHSGLTSGEKELTDVNALCDEYLRLAYHGMRTRIKSFNVELKTDLDPALPKIDIVPQDVGRVLLNLINNAFQAVEEVDNPQVTVTTRRMTSPSGIGVIEIRIGDNGTGIPDHLKDKIFQPFFTTKPAGQGTGLGLSLAYDIVTKGYGGTITFNSNAMGSVFTITIPSNAI